MAFKDAHRIEGGRHVRPFGDANHPIFDQQFGVVTVQLILCGARQSHIDRHMPRTNTGLKSHAGALGVVVDTAIQMIFHFHQFGQFFGSEPVFVNDGAT